MSSFITVLTIFVLAMWIGFEVITKVPPILHTPLTSGSNAISGITVIGAMISAGAMITVLTTGLGFLATVLATINVVGGFWMRTTLLAANDAMWSKYRIGEYLNLSDATGAPFTRNPWRAAPFIMGADRPNSGIEALQARGVRYIVCNNAMNAHVGMLAAARSLRTALLHAFVLIHFATMVIFVPYDYDNRLVLPMYLPILVVAGYAVSETVLRLVVRARRLSPSPPASLARTPERGSPANAR